MTALVVAVVFSFCLGAMTALWLTKYRRSGLPRPKVFVDSLGGEEVIVMSFPDHPPWAHSHILSLAIDHAKRTVDLSESFVVFHPFSARVLQRPPVLLKQGLLNGEYALRYWDGEAFRMLGCVAVDSEGGVSWDPVASP